MRRRTYRPKTIILEATSSLEVSGVTVVVHTPMGDLRTKLPLKGHRHMYLVSGDSLRVAIPVGLDVVGTRIKRATAAPPGKPVED